MKPTLLVIVLGLFLFSSYLVVQAEEDGVEPEMHGWWKKGKPKKPKNKQTRPMPSPPPQAQGGFVAPLTRINIPGQSVPQFVVQLNIGNPSVAMNFSVDTMGRHSILPWQTCWNANLENVKNIHGVGNGNGNGPSDRDRRSPPPSNNGNGNDRIPPATPPSLPPSPSTYIVPCTHKVCNGPSYVCDKTRKRCMAYDRYIGKPVDLVTTEVTLESISQAGVLVPVHGVVMGCSEQSAVPYLTTSMASLSPGATSLVSQLSASTGVPRKFAYCLGKPRGAFFVGGAEYLFRQRDFKPKMQYLPMLRPPSAWQRGMGYRLALQAIAVGSGPNFKPLPIDPSLFEQGIIIGTKARYTSLVDSAYQVVRRHFRTVAAVAAANSSITPVASPFPELNLCYKIPQGASVARAPKIQFIFENATLTVEPRNYIVRYRKTSTVCLGIVSAGPLGKLSAIGTLQQEQTLVEYDLDKHVVGVSEQLTVSGHSCDFLAGAPAPASVHQLGDSYEEDEFVSD